MKKNKLKKTIAIFLSAACMCGTSSIALAEGGNGNGEDNNSLVSPMYIAISTTYTSLTVNSNGSFKCAGNTMAHIGYNAGIVAELQKYDGGWTTIKSWSNYDARTAAVSNNWFVESGYSYRLKTTHYAYDSNWNQVDSVVKYSKTIRK